MIRTGINIVVLFLLAWSAPRLGGIVLSKIYSMEELIHAVEVIQHADAVVRDIYLVLGMGVAVYMLLIFSVVVFVFKLLKAGIDKWMKPKSINHEEMQMPET